MKVARISLVDQVCDAIRGDIVSKKWEPGFKIPSESELAEMFGVNRLTVRMALQKLSTLGLVETRAGEGTFVKKFSFRKYVSEVSDLVIQPEMLEDVCEFRKCIEIECLRLATQCALDEDVEKIEQALLHYEAVCKVADHTNEDDIERYVEADLEFHYRICKASKNTLYPLAYTAVRDPISQYLKAIIIRRCENYVETGRSSSEVFQLGIDSHKLIFTAIKNKDFETGKKAYLSTIDYKYPV